MQGASALGTLSNMIVLFTDFGLYGPYMGQMKAVLHRMAPGIPIVDLFADAPANNDIVPPPHSSAACCGPLWIREGAMPKYPSHDDLSCFRGHEQTS